MYKSNIFYVLIISLSSMLHLSRDTFLTLLLINTNQFAEYYSPDITVKAWIKDNEIKNCKPLTNLNLSQNEKSEKHNSTNVKILNIVLWFIAVPQKAYKNVKFIIDKINFFMKHCYFLPWNRKWDRVRAWVSS